MPKSTTDPFAQYGNNLESRGAIKGRWEIHRILHGGMGSVYLVYDHEWREPFAMKTFQDGVFADNPRIADRFVEEAHRWINLDEHENVTRARLVQQIDGKPYLFLEYVSGGDLSHWIMNERLKRDPSLVLRFAIQFCDGMVHANSKGIQVHRDIKPQNCLVTQNQVLKVTDFGLAKAFDEISVADFKGGARAVRAVGLTGTGTALGTCTHMSPEQFYDSKGVDTRADIYSFGITMFQMVTGNLPFNGNSLKEYEHLHRCEPLPRLANIDRDLRSILEKCTAKAPAERFQNFAVLRQHLVQVFERVTGQAVPRSKVGQELDAYSLVNKGLSLNQLGRSGEALTCYDKALSLNPRIAQAWTNEAAVFGAAGNHKEALRCSKRSLEIDPNHQQGWFNLGIAMNALGQVGEAVSCFERAHILSPHDDNAWYAKATALSRLGRSQEAIVTYEQWIEASPGNASAWFNMGGLWRKLGNNTKSLACYEQATRLKPDYAHAWFNKALVLGMLGNFEGAVEAANQTILLTPEDADAWFTKGLGLEELCRFHEAIDCFVKAGQLGHDHARRAILNCERKTQKPHSPHER